MLSWISGSGPTTLEFEMLNVQDILRELFTEFGSVAWSKTSESTISSWTDVAWSSRSLPSKWNFFNRLVILLWSTSFSSFVQNLFWLLPRLYVPVQTRKAYVRELAYVTRCFYVQCSVRLNWVEGKEAHLGSTTVLLHATKYLSFHWFLEYILFELPEKESYFSRIDHPPKILLKNICITYRPLTVIDPKISVYDGYNKN